MSAPTLVPRSSKHSAVALEPGLEISVGRVKAAAPSAGFRRVLNVAEGSQLLSRSQCRIWLQDGRVVIRDTSTNGTFVDGQRLAKNEDTVLAPGSVVCFSFPNAAKAELKVDAPVWTLHAPAAAAPAAAAPAAAKPAAAKLPSLLAGKKLIDIMELFRGQVGEQVTKFAAQAREVDAWDRKTLEQRDRALALHETTERLKQGNTAINAELEAMLLHQEEVHAALSELEKKVAAEVASPRAPSERQQVYTLVEGLDRDLADTRADVDALVERLNAARDADGMVGAAQHLGKLVRAMDVQVNAFEWLEAEQAKLDAQLAGLDTQLGRR